MPISNLVESAVNLAEKVTGRDIDGDGDVGVAGNVSAKEQLDDAKERKKEDAKLPIFDKTTPKVSVLDIGMMDLDSAKNLVDAAVDQTVKFKEVAQQKAAFACEAYTTENPDTQVKKCILKNGTGVRLLVINFESIGLDPYRPPEILEPGENAFFLEKTVGLSLTLNIQVFQGPMGWLSDANFEGNVTVTRSTSTVTRSTFVEVIKDGTKYDTDFVFSVSGVVDNEISITVRQTIRA